jgi:TIR domain
MAQERTRVFISYSHHDAEWLQRLQVHPRPLVRASSVDVWADARITPGLRWQEEIRRALDSTKVAVLLISADFLASEFIAGLELPVLLEAAQNDGAIILPVIISPSLFAMDQRLSQFQAVNSPEMPLIDLPTPQCPNIRPSRNCG